MAYTGALRTSYCGRNATAYFPKSSASTGGQQVGQKETLKLDPFLLLIVLSRFFSLSHAANHTYLHACVADLSSLRHVAVSGQFRPFAVTTALDVCLQLLSTVPLNLNGNVTVQFSISFGCQDVGSFSVFVEASTDNGVSWSSVLPSSCNPLTTGGCTSWQGLGSAGPSFASPASSTYSAGWQRMTLMLNNLSGSRRFRIRADGTGTNAREWAIADLYIGTACPRGCAGHGVCNGSGCACDADYQVDSAGVCVPSRALPTDFDENFEGSSSLSSNWLTERATGGQVAAGTSCGPAGSGNGFFFNQTGLRALISRDVDTRNAASLQYALRLGTTTSTSACSSPTQLSEGVAVLFSADGGLQWTVLQTISYLSYANSATVVSIQSFEKE